jgi:hypothetical protein
MDYCHFGNITKLRKEKEKRKKINGTNHGFSFHFCQLVGWQSWTRGMSQIWLKVSQQNRHLIKDLALFWQPPRTQF